MLPISARRMAALKTISIQKAGLDKETSPPARQSSRVKHRLKTVPKFFADVFVDATKTICLVGWVRQI